MAFVWASPALARESKLEQLAEYGNGQQMKQYLMTNKRFPQSELDKALFAALYNNDISVLRILLAAGADPNAEPDNSELEEEGLAGDESAWWSPLEHACCQLRDGSINPQRDINIIVMLLQAGARPYGSILGQSVPHLIAQYGNDAAVETMIKTGKIDKSYLDEYGLTLYDFAKRNKQLSARVRNMLR